MKKLKLLLVFLVLVFLMSPEAYAQKKTKSDTTAVAVDTTNSSLHPKIQKGFIPIPIIITEPALGGIGGGLALGYLHTNRKDLRKNTPPTISGVFGGYTANKTWFVGIGHSQSFLKDKIRYKGGLMKANINMTFYDSKTESGNSHPFEVNLDSWGIIQKFTFRMGKTNLFIGPQYIYFGATNTLEKDTEHPRLDSLSNHVNKKSSLGMLGLLLEFDSRDNTLSPNKGIYTGIDINYNATFFGGETDFWELDPYFKYYFPVRKQIFGAVRFDGQFTDGDVPFYAVPYVSLRGVPAMRYQGNEVMIVETQWRWQFYKSISILGFVGTGKAMDSLSEFGPAEWIYNYGLGARYGFKQLFDLRVGIDVAWSNEDFAWYFVVGSSF